MPPPGWPCSASSVRVGQQRIRQAGGGVRVRPDRQGSGPPRLLRWRSGVIGRLSAGQSGAPAGAVTIGTVVVTCHRRRHGGRRGAEGATLLASPPPQARAGDPEPAALARRWPTRLRRRTSCWLSPPEQRGNRPSSAESSRLQPAHFARDDHSDRSPVITQIGGHDQLGSTLGSGRGL